MAARRRWSATAPLRRSARPAGAGSLIEIELNLSAADAARLPRLRRIAALKSGRARNQPIRIVWHDTPDAALLDDGLAAAEQRGVWRIEQVLPNGTGLPPGAPSRVLAEAASAAELDGRLPSPLIPVAAFEGRAIGIDLLRDGEPVALRLLDGVMRGVTAERRTARLLLSGAEAAVVDLALDLAGDIELAVPRAAFAAEAMAAARAEEPSPRRLGAPALSPDLSVADAFAYASDHLADVMLHWGSRIVAGDAALEPVHQMRVALRRLRSAISQFRAAIDCPALTETVQGLKALGRALGPARDWDVFCRETGRAVGVAFEDAPVARLLAAAERRRTEHYRTLRAYLTGPDYRRLMIRLVAFPRLHGWEAELDADRAALLGQRLPDFASAVLAKRFRRLQNAGGEIETLAPAALHEVRLLAKQMRYAAEFFVPLFPGKGPRRFIRRLAAVQETLGVLNDGAVAEHLMAELGGSGPDRAFATGVVRGYVAGRGAAQRSEIADTWNKLRRTSPFWE